MVAWPVSLPQKMESSGYNEKPRTGVVRTSMDVGAAKMRRRYTGIITDISGSIKLTRAQAGILDAFFKNDLASGSLPFTWIHQRTGDAVTMRFVEPPQYAPEARGLYWSASLTLEILP